MSRNVYRVRFKEMNGRNGGFGETKSFKTSASGPHDASRKLRKKGVVISVRKIS